MRLERHEDGFCIDAGLLGDLLGLPAHDVHALLRSSQITSICQRGEGEHEGRHRLIFFYKGRRLRLDVDETGRVLQRSVVDMDVQPPASRSERTGS